MAPATAPARRKDWCVPARIVPDAGASSHASRSRFGNRRSLNPWPSRRSARPSDAGSRHVGDSARFVMANSCGDRNVPIAEEILALPAAFGVSETLAGPLSPLRRRRPPARRHPARPPCPAGPPRWSRHARPAQTRPRGDQHRGCQGPAIGQPLRPPVVVVLSSWRYPQQARGTRRPCFPLAPRGLEETRSPLRSSARGSRRRPHPRQATEVSPPDDLRNGRIRAAHPAADRCDGALSP